MKRIILACTLTAASIISAMPSQAASVTITTDDARPIIAIRTGPITAIT